MADESRLERIAALGRYIVMKPEMLITILLVLAVVSAAATWISARRFVQPKVPDERPKVSGVMWGGLMSLGFAFGAVWMWSNIA